jgi:hypothetical protein
MALALALSSLFLDQNDPQVAGIFGANTNITSSNVALAKINEASVYAKSVCETSCSQLTEDITVIISPGAFVGPISFTQVCQITDVDCAIQSIVDAGLKSSLEKIVTDNYDTKLADSSLFGLTKNMLSSSDSLDVTLRNNIFQMVSSSCSFQTNQVISNNYVYVGTGAETGAISFAQSAQISSVDCIIDTIAKNNSFQTDDTTKSANVLGIVIAVVVILVFIIVLVLFLYFLRRGRKIAPKLDQKIYTRADNYKNNNYFDYGSVEFR